MKKIKIDGRSYKVLKIRKVNNYPTKVMAYSKVTKEWFETPRVSLKRAIQKKLMK